MIEQLGFGEIVACALRPQTSWAYLSAFVLVLLAMAVARPRRS